MKLDSILPPSSEINWDVFDYRLYLYRLLIKIRSKQEFGFNFTEENS